MSYGGYRANGNYNEGYGGYTGGRFNGHEDYSTGYGGGYGGGYDKGNDLGANLRKIDWNTQRLEKFEKNFYVEDKNVAARSDKEVQDFRRRKEIIVCDPYHLWTCSSK